MNYQLEQQVKKSKLLKAYTWLVDFYYSWRKHYLIILIVAFVLGVPFGFLDLNQPVLERIFAKIIIAAWTPGILFLHIMGSIHFSVGIRLRYWAKKYNIMWSSEYLRWIDEKSKLK
jgi:hypothetical protein